MYRLAQKRDESGITLIELVVVIAVLGVIAAIAIPSYGAIQATARQNVVNLSSQQILKELRAVVASPNYDSSKNGGRPTEWSEVMMNFNNQIKTSTDPSTGSIVLEKPGMMAFTKGKCIVVIYFSGTGDVEKFGEVSAQMLDGTLNEDTALTWGAAHWDDGRIVSKNGFGESCPEISWNPGESL
jgi:prepilin-type N-terminal cleavage/methylation domain-containing protein